MISLNSTTDNLQAVLDGAVAANQLQCTAFWVDNTATSVTPGNTQQNTNNTTDVNVVPAPSASTQRILELLTVYNSDTATAVVTLKLDKNGTESQLGKWTLGAGERIVYTRQAGGFDVYDASGVKKSSVTTGLIPTTSNLQTVVLGADRTNNNGTANTIADVTGLSFAVTSGKLYWFRFVIFYTSAATTTGSRWSINGPGSPTQLAYQTSWALTAALGTDGVTTAIQNTYDTPAACNATSLTAGNVAVIEGFIQPSSDGTVVARFASEVSSSAIVAKAGSVVFFQQLT